MFQTVTPPQSARSQPVPLAQTHHAIYVADRRPNPDNAPLEPALALARLRKLYIDANSPMADGYQPNNATVREWASCSQINQWATDRVRYHNWTFLVARGVVDQAEFLIDALEQHVEDCGEDPFDHAFPTASLIEPPILLDDMDVSNAEAGE